MSAPAAPLPVAAPADHPGVRSALMLGLIAVVGCVFVLPLLLGPPAWYRGARVMREIDREPRRWSGRQRAASAAVLGMVASALLVVVVLALVVAATLAVISLRVDTGYGS